MRLGNMKNIGHNIRSSGGELNHCALKYESRMLLVRPQYSGYSEHFQYKNLFFQCILLTCYQNYISVPTLNIYTGEHSLFNFSSHHLQNRAVVFQRFRLTHTLDDTGFSISSLYINPNIRISVSPSDT